MLALDNPSFTSKLNKPRPPKNLVLLHKIIKNDITYYVVGKRVERSDNQIYRLVVSQNGKPEAMKIEIYASEKEGDEYRFYLPEIS
jgi:hypothetical protein